MSINFHLATALYGGSFDPLHEGHLHVARAVKAARPDIQQIVFVPAATSPGKQAFAPPALRLEWLSSSVEAAGFLVWDEEIRRAGESYTVHTLEAAHKLGANPNQLYWIMGADAYASLPQWKNPARIRELAQLLVVNRPGAEIALQDRRDQIVAVEPHPASSTEIRAQLEAGNISSPWLPPAVRESIKKALPASNPYGKKR